LGSPDRYQEVVVNLSQFKVAQPALISKFKIHTFLGMRADKFFCAAPPLFFYTAIPKP